MECNSLEEVRNQIDQIDRAILALIARRGEYVRQAAAFKTSAQDVQAPGRVEAVIAKARAFAAECGADPDMAEELYRAMIGRFIRMEQAAFERAGEPDA